MAKFRVVRHMGYRGLLYHVEIKRRWYSPWRRVDSISEETAEAAEEKCREWQNRVVKEWTTP